MDEETQDKYASLIERLPIPITVDVDGSKLPPRKLFVDGCPLGVAKALWDKGFHVVEVMGLPRTSEAEHAEYLLAFMQGVVEGTLFPEKTRLRAVELEMKARGMLDRVTRGLRVKVDLGTVTIDQVFGWAADRHTLAKNATVLNALPESAKKQR